MDHPKAQEPELSVRSTAQMRRDRILELLHQHREVPVSWICNELQASPPSVRRDLRNLESRGLIRRSYGRVLAVPGSLWELDLKERQRHLPDSYSDIAHAAINQLGDAETVFLDEGNLLGIIAPLLPTDRQLTIVTASLPIALSVAEHSAHEVIMIGGRIRKRTLASTSFWAQNQLEAMTIDLALIGANGVSANSGLTTPDERVAQIKRTAIKSSRRRIFVGEHGRFGIAQFVRFASVSDIDLFITDSGLSPTQLRSMELAGASVQLVP